MSEMVMEGERDEGVRMMTSSEMVMSEMVMSER
jgi:hypothetical protein